MKTRHCLKIFICLLMVLSVITGCGSQKQATTENKAAKGQVIVFGGDIYPPFVYSDDDGKLTGIDIELIKEVCRRLGVDYRYKLINWNHKDEILASGQVDALWACFSMNEREQKYLWTAPYLETKNVIIVGKHSNIKRVEDLGGRRLVLQYSTLPEELFLKYEKNGLPKVHDLYSVNNVDSMFSSLQMGYADAASCNEIVAKLYCKRYPKDFVILDEPLVIARVGVAFAKNRADLCSKVDAALQEMHKDGTIDKIIQKYEKMM